MSHQSKDAITCHAASGKLHWTLFVCDSQSVLVCLFNLLYSSIIYLQYCINLCCTVRCLSYTYIHICTSLFIFLYIMAYPRILNTASCTIQLILHSQPFSPSPTLLGNHRSVLQKPLMFPLQDKKLELCPKMQSWCSIRDGTSKHWLCKYTNTSWPKCRADYG